MASWRRRTCYVATVTSEQLRAPGTSFMRWFIIGLITEEDDNKKQLY